MAQSLELSRKHFFVQGRQRKDRKCTYNVTLSHIYGTVVAISITYSELVFVALVIQHAMHIVICGLSGSTILYHVISQTAQFVGEGGPSNVCFNFP
jgi:hypothetical protein